jgi:hypothetical protein
MSKQERDRRFPWISIDQGTMLDEWIEEWNRAAADRHGCSGQGDNVRQGRAALIDLWCGSGTDGKTYRQFVVLLDDGEGLCSFAYQRESPSCSLIAQRMLSSTGVTWMPRGEAINEPDLGMYNYNEDPKVVGLAADLVKIDSATGNAELCNVERVAAK